MLGNDACVLMFHGIGEIPDHIEADERPYWIGWELFDRIIDHVGQRSKDDRRVIFTFDDGNASDLSAASKLAAAALDGRFFVLAGRIGRTDYLSASEIAEITSLGMEVGLHGRQHCDWRKLAAPELEVELTVSREEISAASGRPVTSVAIPFGAYNRTVMQRLHGDDFEHIHTSDPGVWRAASRIVRRNTITAAHSLENVIDIIDDRMPLKSKLRRAITPPMKRIMNQVG